MLSLLGPGIAMLSLPKKLNTLLWSRSFLETDACWLKMVKSHMAAKHRDTWGEVTAGTCAIGGCKNKKMATVSDALRFFVAAVFDKEKQVLYCGNLGDSRCVVGSELFSDRVRDVAAKPTWCQVYVPILGSSKPSKCPKTTAPPPTLSGSG